MSLPLRILVVTDSFPPVCGGSGWSTWDLVRGLIGRGHHVHVVKAEIGPGASITDHEQDSVPVTTFRRPAPRVPAVGNVAKNEWLWRELAAWLETTPLATGSFDIVHAQHVMTTVPAVRAGHAAGVPVVATVRDYWPVCYWSDLIYDPSQPALCPECSASMMTRCVRPRAGVAAWSLIPYMRRNLRTKRETLGDADAVIAISTTIADDLRRRAPELAGTSLFTIPNPIDMSALDAAYAASARPPIEGPYVLYAGKLAVNKGVQYLVPALAEAKVRWPLVIAGDGPLGGALEAEARAAGVNLHRLGWLDRPAVWPWMRHATMLAFPSYGPESLSRVLIEAAGLGVPIAAMATGGTRDILTDRVTALVSTDAAGFARHLAELAADERLRGALGHAARADVRVRFSATSVVERVEQVYRHLLAPGAA
jgi:glycosyltransferase involved in cell wall biosynthesis